MQWVSDVIATPPMFHDLMKGRKTVATVRRVTGKWHKRQGKSVYRHHYQVVTKWVGAMGDAYGPVFTSLAKAQAFVMERARA